MPTRNNALKFTALMIAMDLAASTSYLRGESYLNATYGNAILGYGANTNGTSADDKQDIAPMSTTTATVIASVVVFVATLSIVNCLVLWCGICCGREAEAKEFVRMSCATAFFPISIPLYLCFSSDMQQFRENFVEFFMKFLIIITSPLWGVPVLIYQGATHPGETRRLGADIADNCVYFLSMPFRACYNLSSGFFSGCSDSDAGTWLIANMAGLLGLFALLGEYLSGAKKRVVDTLSFLCLCASELRRPLLETQPESQEFVTIPLSSLTISADELGKGGFGIVYKGMWNQGSGAITVAVKELTISGDYSSTIIKNEVGIHGRLRHDNIVKLWGACFEEGRSRLIMEYMVGGSLYKALRQFTDIPLPIKRAIMRDIAAGLSFLHSEGVIHCDLKTLNVLLTEDKRAKLSDFGLSSLKDGTTRGTVVKKSSTFCCGIFTRKTNDIFGGTPEYMAPELLEMGAANSRSSDVYAFGRVMCSIFSRKEPFEGIPNNDGGSIRAWVKEGKNPAISANTPPEISALIELCWSKEAEKRPTVAGIITALGNTPADSARALNSHQI